MWHDGEYKCINAGKKVRELDIPENRLRWFWDPVEAFGLHHLIYTGYSSVTHAMIRALCERLHTETNSFHLPVGEMTITLNGVYNLLHIPIQGHMLDHDAAIDRDRELDLMIRLLGMSKADARVETRIRSPGDISYPTLKQLYEAHLTEARRLEDP